MTAAKKAVDPLTPWQRKVEAAIKENTEITTAIRSTQLQTSQQIAALTDKVDPVVDAYSSIQRGVRFLDAVGRGWEWLVRKWKPILAAVVIAKLVLAGANWTEAWHSGVKFLRGEV